MTFKTLRRWLKNQVIEYLKGEIKITIHKPEKIALH
jgi:hypothetical protein